MTDKPKSRVRRAKKPPSGWIPVDGDTAKPKPFYLTPPGGEFVPERVEPRMTIAGLADRLRGQQLTSEKATAGGAEVLYMSYLELDYARAHGLLDDRL